MEVILITPNTKYETLVSPSKMIQSSTVDMISLIETQVFLNHHYNVSFYCLRNNFPYQFHYPLKISKQFLDRNEGAVELYISNGLYFKIQSDTDTLQILSNVQTSLQGVESEQNIIFTLKYWDIQIRMIILNEVPHQQKIKELISAMQESKDSLPQATNSNTNPNNMPIPSSINTTSANTSQLIKILLFIDENNYEEFIGWAENQSDFFDFQLNEKLSKEYMLLKQEIDNQKNSFRNKIKMVETILGENVNIDKLLNQEKEENQQYKRLKETFQTIKNIDNVIIEQERKIQKRTEQFKQKRSQKHRVHYENAQKFAKHKLQISQLLKQIEQLKYKVNCVNENKVEYQSRRNFEPNNKVKSLLAQQVNRCKAIVKNISNPFPISKQSMSKRDGNVQQSLASTKKNKTLQSLHKSQKKQLEKYQNILKQRATETQVQKQKKANYEKQRIFEDMRKYEGLLKNLSVYYESNHKLLRQIKYRIGVESRSRSRNTSCRQKNKQREAQRAYSNKGDLTSNKSNTANTTASKITSLNSSVSSPSTNTPCAEGEQSPLAQKIHWNEQQFVVLTQLLQLKPTSYYYSTLKQRNNDQIYEMLSANNNSNNSNKVGSTISINPKYPSFRIDEDKERDSYEKHDKHDRFYGIGANLGSGHKYSNSQGEGGVSFHTPTASRIKNEFQKSGANSTHKLIKTKNKPIYETKKNQDAGVHDVAGNKSMQHHR